MYDMRSSTSTSFPCITWLLCIAPLAMLMAAACAALAVTFAVTATTVVVVHAQGQGQVSPIVSLFLDDQQLLYFAGAQQNNSDTGRDAKDIMSPIPVFVRAHHEHGADHDMLATAQPRRTGTSMAQTDLFRPGSGAVRNLLRQLHPQPVDPPVADAVLPKAAPAEGRRLGRRLLGKGEPGKTQEMAVPASTEDDHLAYYIAMHSLTKIYAVVAIVSLL